ncbi:MAG: hypothetical protein V4712_17650 [Pseudomonadota bacterium]
MSYEAWGDNDEPSAFDAAMEAGWLDPTDLSKALIDVMNERDRQWNEVGFTSDSDDKYIGGELALAAAEYTLLSTGRYGSMAGGPTHVWPWSRAWWKPKTPRRNLVKAAALILAEIERLDRAEARS